jgi:heme oxygenase
MSLKEITKDLHHEAEKTAFAKLLLSGKITEKQYAAYLFNINPIYFTIEKHAAAAGVFDRLPGLQRSEKIWNDFLELTGGDVSGYKMHKETLAYQQYLEDLAHSQERNHLLRAHMYVRHMGDLFGGQIIKNRVPGSGTFYDFDNVEELKTGIRAELDDGLGDEARIAFEWAIKMMKALDDSQ